MNKTVRSMPWQRILIISIVAAMAGGAGCHLLVDPFTDELAQLPPATTPSVDAARAAKVERLVSRRPYQTTQVYAKDGTVTHGPLYYEDPFVDRGSEDGSFAWTSEDYLYWIYGPAHFLVNTAFFPVNAARTPPWQVMAGDGRATEPVHTENGPRR